MKTERQTQAPQLRTRWLHDSGGLIWHLRALRYRNTLWSGFRSEVKGWLQSWQPPTDKLIIIGPSAGYTLDASFLQRWQEIIVLEPDPLARRLLRWRYADARWRFENLDVLSDINALAMLAKGFAGHAILFSNVLGQITPRNAAASWAWKQELRKALAGHYWASYHDVISTARPPDAEPASAPPPATGLDEILVSYWHGGELEIVDHCTYDLGANARLRNDSGSAYCIWRLLPRQYHLVEWCSSEPAADQIMVAGLATEKDC
ncbi:MAG: hypothetical protein JWL63_915 [Rhodocyclales bacterium]|nr:hypothetical protein [Rhodocyclales bacterium]